MTSGFSFWDGEIWSFVVTLSLLFGAMLLANCIRRKVPFFQQSLLPSSVLGGFLLLIISSIYKAITGNDLMDLTTLEALTYHGLGLGFIALAWRHLDGVKGKKARKDVFNTSTVTVGGYLIQGFLGLTITIILYFLIGSFYGGGILLPMGYGQGPGQAFNWGATYENSYGFTNGTSFGLAIAAMGFVSASVGGLIYLNKSKRQVKSETLPVEDSPLNEYRSDNEIPVSESMDKLTVQFALVFLTYAVSYASMWLMYRFVLEPIGGFALNTINPLIWGFNFLVGTAWAILFKSIGNKLRKKEIIHREYTNNFMLNRISGVMFDIMVVSSIASINLSAFKYKEFWIPLLLLCIVGALATYWYVLKVCKHLFPDYTDEMFLAMYGMLTGTASTGVILLREVDPLYKTPASHNLIYQNLWSIILGAPMLLVMGFIPRSLTHTLVCYAIIILLFIFILILQYRDKLFHHKKKSE